jgi:Ca-activated chloride channel family protein
MYLTFQHPEYLWYLLSLPLLIISHFAFLKYSRRKAIRFANFQALKKVSDQKILTKNHLILIIRSLILTFLILSIAGTTLWYKGFTNQNDFILAIDTSASMTAQDFTPTRLEAAKKYTVQFLNNLKSDSNVGVVSFSGAAMIEQLPSKDFGALKQAITALEIAHVGGTNIPDAIVTGTNLLLPSKKGKAIVLLTDGSNTASYFTRDPITEAIKYAKQNSVIIYTIGLGTNTGPIGYLPEYYNISAVSDQNTLFRLANETGGKYYNAVNTDELQNAYNDITSNSLEAYLNIELSLGLLILAMALLFMEWGLISTRFRAIP